MAKREQEFQMTKRGWAKKQKEFSQRLTLAMVIFSMGIVFYVITLNAVLLFLDKVPMPTETIAVIQVFGAVVSVGADFGYKFLAGWRDNSKNKHGVTALEIGNSPVADNEDLPVI